VEDARLLDGIRNRLAQLGRPDVRIIGVSKTHGPERIRGWLEAGLRDFGENRQNEARDKFPLVPVADLPPERRPIYHHIGPLQSGAARQIPGLFTYVHGVGSSSALEALQTAAARHAERERPPDDPERWPLRFLIQVRLTDEASKAGGFSPEELAALREIPETPECRFAGFMTMGPADGDLAGARSAFAALRALRDARLPGGELSMGMSGDWELAVEEGATMIRIGSALFGQRAGGPWRPG
jgi:PLP dependent protein